MKTVLFACVHNTGRSQMAEAFFNRLADPAKAQAISGGTEPATDMNPTVIAVMKEVGVELVAEGHRPKIADLDQLREGDRPISMACATAVAPVHEAERLHADLRRAGIEPYAWVVNRSLARSGTRDPLLLARAVGEVRYIREVAALAARFTVRPWAPAGATVPRHRIVALKE